MVGNSSFNLECVSTVIFGRHYLSLTRFYINVIAVWCDTVYIESHKDRKFPNYMKKYWFCVLTTCVNCYYIELLYKNIQLKTISGSKNKIVLFKGVYYLKIKSFKQNICENIIENYYCKRKI